MKPLRNALFAALIAATASCGTLVSESQETEKPKKAKKPVAMAPQTTPPRPEGKKMLPDLALVKLNECSAAERRRNLGQCFSIVEDDGRRLLKFPVTTVNVGKGPIEIRATRSGITANDWKPVQRIYYKNGKTWDVPVPGLAVYYAGDGHEHWHLRDLTSMAIGGVIDKSEKHGFCFEDNTEWQSGKEVYDPDEACGKHQVDAIEMVQGLTVGAGDTYPTTLVDQGINVTGLPNGVYKIKVTADWENHIREVSESNNTATAVVEIRGSLVRPISADKGLPSLG